MAVSIKALSGNRLAQLNGTNAGRKAIRIPEVVTQASFVMTIEMARERITEQRFYLVGFIIGMREQLGKLERELMVTLRMEETGSKALPHSHHVEWRRADKKSRPNTKARAG